MFLDRTFFSRFYYTFSIFLWKLGRKLNFYNNPANHPAFFISFRTQNQLQLLGRNVARLAEEENVNASAGTNGGSE